MTGDEDVLGFGFKFCNIPIYRWFWMLFFLLNKIWVGSDEILLKFSQLSVQFWTAGYCMIKNPSDCLLCLFKTSFHASVLTKRIQHFGVM